MKTHKNNTKITQTLSRHLQQSTSNTITGDINCVKDKLVCKDKIINGISTTKIVCDGDRICKNTQFYVDCNDGGCEVNCLGNRGCLNSKFVLNNIKDNSYKINCIGNNTCTNSLFAVYLTDNTMFDLIFDGIPHHTIHKSEISPTKITHLKYRISNSEQVSNNIYWSIFSLITNKLPRKLMSINQHSFRQFNN